MMVYRSVSGSYRDSGRPLAGEEICGRCCSGSPRRRREGRPTGRRTWLEKWRKEVQRFEEEEGQKEQAPWLRRGRGVAHGSPVFG